MKPGNIFASIPPDLDDELFEVLISSDSVIIEKIVSRGHQSPESGWYDQNKNEWVLVLRGSARLMFDDHTEVSLETGDFIHIPSHKKHRVSWTDSDRETIWLAVHF
ncbi:cupin 2 domain-containing protein [Nitrosomonas sp. Nm51]|uniref:cupin domain-containing protein n=1 Tax=Nitrosomonas sp. Nm51 TaxID=133720 RepID=UPI0008C7B578|nr:cupin domain-containing protein [Nitrosomonas sp. Nm51]SER18413.1 cupin 2 domain-containing protein [Nitrosomonas sp. Nm51]